MDKSKLRCKNTSEINIKKPQTKYRWARTMGTRPIYGPKNSQKAQIQLLFQGGNLIKSKFLLQNPWRKNSKKNLQN